MMQTSATIFVLATALLGGCTGDTSVNDRSQDVLRLSGAIFTTTADGSRVDANIYAAKEDVYLDGGPPANAPAGAAGLPDGDYYFQVTDPSGKTLLSLDAITCREFTVTGGVISGVVATGCEHVTGTDVDHGAVTVQLMPYANTPNPGGEYKVWATPVGAYSLTARNNVFGFVPRFSKTDNFKVLTPTTPPPPPVCGDDHVDAGEQCDDGNTVSGDGCSSTCQLEVPPPPPPPPPPPCCGDGHLDAGEQCDDGNTVSGDGCSSTCQLETPTPPVYPCCGDGQLDTNEGEQCDDGNLVDGDGCSSTCQIELR